MSPIPEFTENQDDSKKQRASNVCRSLLRGAGCGWGIGLSFAFMMRSPTHIDARITTAAMTSVAALASAFDEISNQEYKTDSEKWMNQAVAIVASVLVGSVTAVPAYLLNSMQPSDQ